MQKLTARRTSEQAARAPAVGRRLGQQLNSLIRETNKNLHTICIKMEGEEVDPCVRAVGYDRRWVPLRLAVLVLVRGHHTTAEKWQQVARVHRV